MNSPRMNKNQPRGEMISLGIREWHGQKQSPNAVTEITNNNVTYQNGIKKYHYRGM